MQIFDVKVFYSFLNSKADFYDRIFTLIFAFWYNKSSEIWLSLSSRTPDYELLFLCLI